MTIADRFRAEAAKRILIKDGPYGTAVQALGLVEADYRGGLGLAMDQKGNNDLLNLTRPAAIARICDAYLAAGADVVATNSFNANRISQADYGAEHLVGDINRAAAAIIRDCADRASAADGRPRFVAGALGPTNKTLSLSPRVSDPGFREVDFDGVKAVYREQIDALVAGDGIRGGVDIILIETVFDTLNAKAAAFAAAEASEALGRELPVMLSMTLTDLSGRNLSGQTVEAFWHSIAHVKPLSVGLNCSFGATELRPHVAALAKVADTLVQVYPNAGLPNDLGEYDEAPATTGGLIGDWAMEGLVNIVGGCCGTTPAHIAAMARAVGAYPPRAVPRPVAALRLSGLEAYSFAA
jgi:5-methyltetrahydrofolate--homocysteine methyltransferase